MPVGALGEHGAMTAATSSGVSTSAGYFLPAFGAVRRGSCVVVPLTGASRFSVAFTEKPHSIFPRKPALAELSKSHTQLRP